MKEITSLNACSFRDEDQVVAALGFFDGLHLAHRRIVEECIRRAKARRGVSLVFTFQNHPSGILTPGRAIRLLTPYPIKLQILEPIGVDVVVGVPFDLPISRTSARDFIDHVLCERLRAKEIVVGFNFFFGRNREGTVEQLQKLVPERFENVTVLEPLLHEDQPVSSTLIRQNILQGRLEEVSKLLLRPYQIAGYVVTGAGRGRTLGIPTANLDTGGQVLPPNGVYGVRVRKERIDAPPIWGVMNIGANPTFQTDSSPSVEVHLLDFDGDLYHQYLIVDVLRYLRAEQKFASPQELVAQIQRDVEGFREWIQTNKI